MPAVREGYRFESPPLHQKVHASAGRFKLISTSAGQRRSRSPTTVAAKSPSTLSRPASTSNTAAHWSGLRGRAWTKWTKFLATDSAELLDDGSIEIEFAYHNGDEAACSLV
jgi:hypothetical protein